VRGMSGNQLSRWIAAVLALPVIVAATLWLAS
jgi:hypothetical protein